MRGIRLVIEEFRADVTKTLKDGSRGKLRVAYGDPKEPEKPIAWLWKFIICRAGGYAEPAYRSSACGLLIEGCDSDLLGVTTPVGQRCNWSAGWRYASPVQATSARRIAAVGDDSGVGWGRNSCSSSPRAGPWFAVTGSR